MRAHAEAVRDRFEVLLLLVNTVAAAPPPCLVYEGAVSRVHQANDAVVDADRHFGLQVGEFVFPGELLDLRRTFGRFDRGSETRAGRAGIRYEDPDEAVLLLAGIAVGIDAIDF